MAALGITAVVPAFVLGVSIWTSRNDRALWRAPEADRLARYLARLDDLDVSSTSYANTNKAAVAVRPLIAPRSVQYSSSEVDAFRLYIADRFSPTIADERTWRLVTGPRGAELRRIARDAVTRAAAASPADRANAATTARRIVEREQQRDAERPSFWVLLLVVTITLQFSVAVVTGLISVMLSLAFRGPPTLRLFGYGIAGPDGRRAGRLRATWRSVIAWAPAFVAVAILTIVTAIDASTRVRTAVVLIMGTVAAAQVVWTCVSHTRGLHDRLARTRVVPL
jgi:hypothetical protein